MDDDQTTRDDEAQAHDRTVRPRGVWGALVIGVAGAVTAGAGVAVGSWIVSAIGAAVLLVGAAVGARSGGMYGVHGARPLEDQVSDVKHDRTYEGVAPGDTVSGPEVRRTSKAVDQRHEQIVAERAAAPPPSGAPIAGVVLLITAVVLLVAPGNIYPLEPEARVDAQRALGVAIVAAVTGLRYLVSPGRHVFFAAAAALAGAALVLYGVFGDHLETAPAVLEIVTGTVVILAAAGGIASPRRRRV